MMDVNFKTIAYGSSDWRKAVELREQVLRKPLGQVFSEQELADESTHIQIAGYVESELVACAVLVPEKTTLKMQRVAVSESIRNLNIGSRMMVFCETYATENGFDNIYCHARDTAVNFYLRNGYMGEGDYFDEDGIPHLKMAKRL